MEAAVAAFAAAVTLALIKEVAVTEVAAFVAVVTLALMKEEAVTEVAAFVAVVTFKGRDGSNNCSTCSGVTASLGQNKNLHFLRKAFELEMKFSHQPLLSFKDTLCCHC